MPARLREATAQAATTTCGSAEQVEDALENITVISEQTAARSEEVPAATNVQATKLDHLAEQARDLAALANDLHAAIGQFAYEQQVVVAYEAA